ncbi:hypothetical protein [Streptomyces cacaoi]|uniref:hypothetical protein n=1 Tax=Streptomyces cacaoi TaxID=1898 RepID=UPI002611E674|nr:hypothetical protein [Streptomyces cacaoi]
MVTRSSYAQSVRSAFDQSNPLGSVEAVKQTVINELRETDSRVAVKSTEYFNHSYAPDLILRWPQEEATRHLFLRTDPNPSYLAEDLEIARGSNSIFFALASPERRTELENNDTLRSAAHETSSLVTDADGLEEFIDRRREAPVVSLASSAILQGGRGVVQRSEALAVSQGISDGFSAAQVLDVPRTRSAARIVGEVFDEVRSARLTRFLHAVWVGSGGDAASFPAPGDVVGPLDDEALSFLLDLEEIIDDQFWRRIGRSLTLERLGGLTIQQPSPNLQRLVNNNLDVLFAKICRIVSSQSALWEDIPSLGWSIDRGMLSLQGEQFTAFLAAKKEDLNVSAEDADGISIDQLISRAIKRKISIAELELATTRRTLTYGSDRVEDVTRDAELANFADVLGSSTRVSSAIASISGARNLRCDFKALTAQGRTAARFPVAEILYAAIGLLLDLRESEAERLDAFFARSAAVQHEESGTLFDLEEIP